MTTILITLAFFAGWVALSLLMVCWLFGRFLRDVDEAVDIINELLERPPPPDPEWARLLLEEIQGLDEVRMR